MSDIGGIIIAGCRYPYPPRFVMHPAVHDCVYVLLAAEDEGIDKIGYKLYSRDGRKWIAIWRKYVHEWSET